MIPQKNRSLTKIKTLIRNSQRYFKTLANVQISASNDHFLESCSEKRTKRKAAKKAAKSICSEASKVIISNSMDDILGSTTNEVEGKQVMNDAECLLGERGFKIK